MAPLPPFPWIDVLIIAALVALNGVFAMSELAIVSARKARLEAMAVPGVRAAVCNNTYTAHQAVEHDDMNVLCLGSRVVGGALALAKDELKQILAHSTISQYGYVVSLYGMGGEMGAGAAAFYVITHAVAKGALFMTAGAVTEATGGESRLSRLGGLARPMPALAVASGRLEVRHTTEPVAAS